MQGVFPWEGTLLVLFHKLIVKHSTLVGVNQSISKFMDKDIFMFGDSGNSSIASMLPALMQNRGIDSAALMGMMANGNNGFFGNNGGFQDIIALIVIAAIFGNGNFGFGGNNNGRGDTERQMLMDAMQRNGIDISQLASAVNCSKDQILAGINSVSGAICGLGNQMGQNTNQIIMSLMQGNNALTSQICSCCCDLKGLIAGLNTGMERGFASIAYETQRQTCDITKSIEGSTAQILAGQRQAEMREMQRELAERDRKIAEQAVIINNGQQTAIFSQMIGQATAPIAAAVQDLQGDINGIKCKLPETATVPYSPIVGVPTCVAAQYGLGFGLNGFGNGFWG